jgi:hypothetical protein
MRRVLRTYAAEDVARDMTRKGATNGRAPVMWQTPEELSELIQQREYALELLPEGEVRHSVQADIAQLRRRADLARMKAAGASVTVSAETNGTGSLPSAH